MQLIDTAPTPASTAPACSLSTTEPAAPVVRGQSPPPPERERSQAFLLARATLVVTTAYMVLAQTGFGDAPGPVVWLILFGLLACGGGFALPVSWLDSSLVTGAVLVVDTAWITALLVSAGSFEPEFFYLYFFVLFLAAIGERLGLIALGTVVVCAAYLYTVTRSGQGSGFDSASLIRLPFLLAVATFYGYLVDRVRRERQRARVEAASVRRLEEAGRKLEAANRSLEREVRERRRAEEEVRKLSRAVEQSPAVVIIADTEGRVEYVNPRFTAVSGLAAEEAMGRDVRELSGADSSAGEDPVGAAVARRGAWHGEILHRSADGEGRWMSTWISPLLDPGGRQTHVIVVQEDVTDRKQAELSLHEANRELARVSELKSSFVSIVSHELRTPLTSIKNSLDLVRTERTGPLGEDQARFLDMAVRNLDRLGLIIDDLLDLSKIEAGRLAYRFGPVSAADLLDEVQATFEPQAETAGIELAVRVEEGVPPLLGDPTRLAQVLANLVGNALKFTRAGGRVGVGARQEDGAVLLEVDDTGTGIEPDELERIFEPFHQAEDCLTRSTRGTGLGLSVARELVWAHGGELNAGSTPGQGSRFTVRLPAQSSRARELVEMEEALRQQRQFPFSGLLVVCWRDTDGPASLQKQECRRSILLAVRDTLRETLPKERDLVLVQPAHNRLVLVLPSTPREGARTVRGRLERLLSERAIQIDGAPVPAPLVLGPAVYPEDGPTARRLVADLISGGSPVASGEPPTRGDRRDDRPQSDQDSRGGRRAGRGGDGPISTAPGGLRRGDRPRRAGGAGYGALLST